MTHGTLRRAGCTAVLAHVGTVCDYHLIRPKAHYDCPHPQSGDGLGHRHRLFLLREGLFAFASHAESDSGCRRSSRPSWLGRQTCPCRSEPQLLITHILTSSAALTSSWPSSSHCTIPQPNHSRAASITTNPCAFYNNTAAPVVVSLSLVHAISHCSLVHHHCGTLLAVNCFPNAALKRRDTASASLTNFETTRMNRRRAVAAPSVGYEGQTTTTKTKTNTTTQRPCRNRHLNNGSRSRRRRRRKTMTGAVSRTRARGGRYRIASRSANFVSQQHPPPKYLDGKKDR